MVSFTARCWKRRRTNGSSTPGKAGTRETSGTAHRWTLSLRLAFPGLKTERAFALSTPASCFRGTMVLSRRWAKVGRSVAQLSAPLLANRSLQKSRTNARRDSGFERLTRPLIGIFRLHVKNRRNPTAAHRVDRLLFRAWIVPGTQ